MQENKAIPVLVVEDDFLTTEIISEITDEIPSVEVVIVKSKEEALRVLSSRNDFLVAFVDWNLEDGTSQWVIWTIYATQEQIWDIFATSSHDESRKMQLLYEGATHELENKFQIIHEIESLPTQIY